MSVPVYYGMLLYIISINHGIGDSNKFPILLYEYTVDLSDFSAFTQTIKLLDIFLGGAYTTKILVRQTPYKCPTSMRTNSYTSIYVIAVDMIKIYTEQILMLQSSEMILL